MTNPALAIIEEVYSFSLNPSEDYLAQLGSLGPTGELANKVSLTTLLFKLCMLIDTQAKKIAELQDALIAINKETADVKGEANAAPTNGTQPDPTQPLQS